MLILQEHKRSMLKRGGVHTIIQMGSTWPVNWQLMVTELQVQLILEYYTIYNL